MKKILFLTLFASFPLWLHPAFAATYDIREMTPAVRQAIENRQARYEQLQLLKMQGLAGEDNKGLTKVLKELPPDGHQLLESENRDREVIYQAIVEQNQLGPDGIGLVQSTFAEVQRGKARPGEYIQLGTGEWTQK